MKILKKKDSLRFENGSNCIVFEYPLNDPDINGAIAEIKGRYPDKGYCMNEKCKELIYVIKGSGSLNKKDKTINFEEGDMLLIDKKEIYYWDGNCTILMPCTPAWYPKQHKLID